MWFYCLVPVKYYIISLYKKYIMCWNIKRRIWKQFPVKIVVTFFPVKTTCRDNRGWNNFIKKNWNTSTIFFFFSLAVHLKFDFPPRYVLLGLQKSLTYKDKCTDKTNPCDFSVHDKCIFASNTALFITDSYKSYAVINRQTMKRLTLNQMIRIIQSLKVCIFLFAEILLRFFWIWNDLKKLRYNIHQNSFWHVDINMMENFAVLL